MENASDEIIMQSVREGNLAVMAFLFERYHLKVYNYFLKMGLKSDVSQDLTQNLFYRMIKYRKSYDGSSLRSWIFRIARNLHYDYRNQQGRNEMVITYTDNYEVDNHDAPEGFIEEDYERLDYCLSRLSGEQREIIVLSRFQGLKYEEISAITNQSVAAIKVTAYRALKRLRMIYFQKV